MRRATSKKQQLEISIEKLESQYSNRLQVNYDLSRSLVSFQGNKKTPGFRWYKFKEGYSLSLINYILQKLSIPNTARLIDPFAGSGTSLFAASQRGMASTGIELLPIAIEIIEVRKILFTGNSDKYRKKIKYWIEHKPWQRTDERIRLNEINITKGAYPARTKESIEKYLAVVAKEQDAKLRRVLTFALLCIVEEVSYTRKDGQYLRWDYRAKKSKTKFNKGRIKTFNEAILGKLQEIYVDTEREKTLFNELKILPLEGEIELLKGSCLNILPTLRDNSFDILITSPPYCNRYDYTRTYALELALLGNDEEKVKNLRQTMLSCTVENREKMYLENLFSPQVFNAATNAFSRHEVLSKIISFLEEKNKNKELNNSGIVRMIRNYFYELALLIFESARILKAGSFFVMVNDNVRYAGVNIPVDLILSDFARHAGFEIETIWVLPRGKGNSSQQMGRHGKKELRKCVYIWRKL